MMSAGKNSASSVEFKKKMRENICKTFKDNLYDPEEDSNIEETLLTININDKLRKTYKAKQGEKIREEDFFFLGEAEPEMPKEQDVEKSDDGIDQIESEEKKMSAMKYFDEEMNEFVSHVSKTIIERNTDYWKCSHLFYDGNEKPLEETTPIPNTTKDGLFVGNKPKLKKYSQHLKNILSYAKNASEWFDMNGDIIMEDNPVKETSDDLVLCKGEDEEIVTVFCKPEKLGVTPMFKNTSTEKTDSIMVLNIKDFSYLYHPLFSIESVIALELEEQYEVYRNNKIKNQVSILNNKIFALLQKKNNIQEQILGEDQNRKKLYKSKEYRDCIYEIVETREQRFSELAVEKKLESNILGLWKLLKDTRKKIEFINTTINIEIIKIPSNIDDERKHWEELFNSELYLSIEHLKCNFIEKKLEYNKQSAGSQRKSAKPEFEFDNAKTRNELYRKMSAALKTPGEPNIVIRLTKVPTLITKTISDNIEQKRRAEVEKVNVFFKIYANDKEICKSKMAHIGMDFVAKFDEVFFLQLDEQVSSIKIIVFEQSYIRASHSISELTIDVPKKTSIVDSEIKSKRFKTTFNKKYSVGIGNCKTVDEVKNKYPQLKELDMNILSKEAFDCEAVLTFNIFWDKNMDIEDNVEKTQAVDSVMRENQPMSKVLSLLFDKMLDPNDPENAFLFKFMNNCDLKQSEKDKFYFDEMLYMRFNTDDMPKKISIEVDRSSIASSRKYDDDLDKFSTSMAELLDPLELQRKMSRKYLELMNDHLSKHWQAVFADKHLSDIITAFKYPGLRSITMKCLRPKQPLFDQTKFENSPKLPFSNFKDYYLKVCILKAFQLPNRVQDIQPAQQDEDALKLATLRPFIHISCQGKHRRTTTVLGPSPTWNEQLILPVIHNGKSTIMINLFDELYEDLLDDDRLEKTTVHFRYNINWLASLKLSLVDMFAQNTIEGTFAMSTPPELLSYKYNSDGKRPSLHIAPDSRKDFQVKQREGIYISLRLEMLPSLAEPPKLMAYSLESNEMDYVVKYLTNVSQIFMNQFPKRKCNLLIVDTSGKTICVTRFLQPLALPEFGEFLKYLFSSNSHHEESQSSKGSTPKRRTSKSKDEGGGRNMQSTFSLNEGRRFSKSTKDTFELKSINENFFESIENDMSYKMQACARYVSLIPFYENNSKLLNQVTLLGMQTVKLVTGSLTDHSILLMSYFIHLEIDCWLLCGMALPRGLSSFVLVREVNNAIQMKNDKRYPIGMKSNVRHFVYDAVDGIKYDVKDPFCPLQSIHYVCNQENIWLNIQTAEQCDFTRFNFSNTSDWRPIFQKNKMPCPGPLSGVANNDVLYNYETQDVKRLREAIEQKVRSKIQKWRGHRKTSWNRYCSSILYNSLIDWEKYNLIPFSTKPKPHTQMQQLLTSYQVFGFPLNFPYTSMSTILLTIKGTQIHMDDRHDIEYALGVDVFPYPNNVYSIWVYLATVSKK